MATTSHTRKQNLTVSLDLQTIRRAKVLAAKQGKSISGLVAHQIEVLADQAEEYERAKQHALAMLDRPIHLGGVIRATRDELHER